MLPAPQELMELAGSENFPVASRLLPRRYRTHLLAIYGFARLVDTIGDEARGNRLAQLDWLEADLERAPAGGATHPLVRRLTPTIDELGLSLAPFRALIAANRVDQHRARYETFDDLLGYCALSAAPVGHLVLAVFGVATPERTRWSDDVCAALQVVEHLQDVGEDARRGRVYAPQADLRQFGVDEQELFAATASPAVRRLVAFECERARGLLRSGRPLVASLGGWARLAVTGYVAGGEASLDAIAAAHHDVLAHTCAPQPYRLVARGVPLLVAKRARP
ncbi:MAG TPA: squalene synthase HpnC [Acidimicrobiales bacterium]|nr:squalene synthase HpnC [Acidimicrobiales bacterium]